MIHRYNCPLCDSKNIMVSRKKCGYEIFLCQLCKTEFANLSASELPSYDGHYENIYDGYNAMFLATKGGASPLYWYQKKILKIVGHGRDRFHLDIGSGLGTFPHITARMGWQSAGTDISPHAAATALNELGVKTLIGELPLLNLEDKSYDWVSAFEVLEHVYEPRSYIKHIIVRRY